MAEPQISENSDVAMNVGQVVGDVLMDVGKEDAMIDKCYSDAGEGQEGVHEHEAHQAGLLTDQKPETQESQANDNAAATHDPPGEHKENESFDQQEARMKEEECEKERGNDDDDMKDDGEIEGGGGGAKVEEPQYIKVFIKSQYLDKVVTVDSSANVEQLRSLVAVKCNLTFEQVCLTLHGKMLNDDSEDLKNLNIVDGTSLQMAVKYNLGNQMDPHMASGASPSPWFLPSQYSKLGLNNVNFVSLQQQMQQQMMANPEMVREMMTNPLVQQLMHNPEVMKKLMMQVPQSREMLNKHPDIFDALNNPDAMKQSLEIAQDPVALQEMLDKMEIPEDSPYINAVPTFNPQSIPTPQTMLRMTAQHPKLLQQMFNSPYYKSMVDGMIANPQWTQQMIINNPMFANNPQLQQQISSLMPYYLQQMQNPQLTSLMSNPDSLKALLKIQHGVSVLQSEAPNLSQSMGFPNIAIPGLMNSTDNISSSNAMGGTDYVGGGARGSADQLDAMSIIMGQLVNQMGTGKINLPDDEKYKEELELMKSMGFHDDDVNLQLLKKTLGNVDTAVTYLLQQSQQQQHQQEESMA